MYNYNRLTQKNLSGQDKAGVFNGRDKLFTWLVETFKPGYVLSWWWAVTIHPFTEQCNVFFYGLYKLNINKNTDYIPTPKPWDSQLRSFYLYQRNFALYSDGTINGLNRSERIESKMKELSNREAMWGVLENQRYDSLKKTTQIFNSRSEWLSYTEREIYKVQKLFLNNVSSKRLWLP